jgi:hypothetical protein
MTANVVRVNSDYKIQCVGGGQIILDTGLNSSGGYGKVSVLGDLTVLGEATVIQSNVINIQDLIITLNVGETGSGVTGSASEPRHSGIQIDRGTLHNNARWLWDETQSYLDSSTGLTKYGLWVSKTVTGGLNGIQTNSITVGDTNKDLYLLNKGTSIISVTGTDNYEQQVLDYANGLIAIDDDIIPNIKAVNDKISYEVLNISFNKINRADSAVVVNSSNITSQMKTYGTVGVSNYVTINHFPITNSNLNIDTLKTVTISDVSDAALNGSWPVITANPDAFFFVVQINTAQNFPTVNWNGNILINSYSSNIQFNLNNVTPIVFNQTSASLLNVNISGSTISGSHSSDDLILQATGSGAVNVNDILKLSYQSAPAAETNTTKIYAGSNGKGQTGLFFVNNNYSGELISKKKAIAFSILM